MNASMLPGTRRLTREEFSRLSEVPSETLWLASVSNPHTARSYRKDIAEFIEFMGIHESNDFRLVTRAHVIAWKQSLEDRKLSKFSVRRKLATVSSLYSFLCEQHAVSTNPVRGVKLPKFDCAEGRTPVLSTGDARGLLDAPDPSTLKGKRDKAVVSVLLYHALRLAEVGALKVGDIHCRQGVPHLRVFGKYNRFRFVPLHPETAKLIADYLQAAGHGHNMDDPLFKTTKRKTLGALSCASIYDLVKRYAKRAHLHNAVCPHSLRVTAATNALDNGAEITEVQRWLGHARITTTQIYDRRARKPENSPTFKVRY